MALAVNVSSSWKYVKQAYVNVNNSWKAVRHIYINSNGTWKPLYSYSWWTGDWSNCSVSCGGGTQTRSVVCVRNHPGQTGHVGDWSDVEAWNYTFVLWNDDNCSINGALYNGTLIGTGGTINKNGYIYSRGNLQRSDSSSGVVINDYSVCRQPA